MRAQLLTKAKLDRFAHGNDGYLYANEIKADFSTNTWYLGTDPQLRNYIKSEVDCISNYPELQSETLTAALLQHHNLSDNQLLVCNGTADAIYYIAQVFRGGLSRILTPTFSGYEQACQVFDHQISYCGVSFLKEGMYTPNGLMWICNPNNPTGQLFSKDLLLSIIKGNPQTTFVVDEAYADFCIEDCSLVPYVSQLKNLLILKSMTKNYCLPGLRLGYVVGHQSLIQKIAVCRPPWSVNSLALKAGGFVLQNLNSSKDDLLAYLSLSRQLQMELEAISGIEVFESSTGFFLMKTPMLAAELKSRLINEFGLLIRDASNFRTLNDYHIRVATLTREKNNLLVIALKELFDA